MEQSTGERPTLDQSAIVRIVLAAAIIAASFVLNLFTTTVGGATYGDRVVTAGPRLVGHLFRQHALFAEWSRHHNTNGGGFLEGVASQQIVLAIVSLILLLIPAAATYLVVRELMHKRSPRLGRSVGITAIYGFIYVLIPIIISYRPGVPITVEFGAGAFILLVCGICMLVVSRGTAGKPGGPTKLS